MSEQKIVLCKKLNKELLGLESPPLLGEIGIIIMNNCSKEAWEDWLEMQIKIINEERLDLSEKHAKERLFNAMIKFLNIVELVEGE